ncbi:sigma factor-like helix-turn-helix DNA-binding protein [Vreelandella massiliensis]|uniref:sigma factor-like helix-turn-helix DNA-binding protein n=1 Tax=Vreelandella massiliensis TaxID=1816686 RepID=UPI00096AACD8|nr:sigma factor-like helix-turn-helix DNA-binding protein [Halomonas massiliensis]
MTGIVTNAYFYLHGERGLQLSTVLKTADGLRRFMDSHDRGVVLYSDYTLSDKKEWAAVCHTDALLDAAASGIAVCPITAAILERLSYPLDEIVGLDGQPLGATPTSPSVDKPMADSDSMTDGRPHGMHPPRMQADRQLQQVFKDAPDVADEMVEKGIETLSDFRQHWETLTTETAEKIAITHYQQVCENVLTHVRWKSQESVAMGCKDIAAAIPPWCDSLTPFMPHFANRTHNVLIREGITSPAKLSTLSIRSYLSWKHSGITTLQNLLKALASYQNSSSASPSFSDPWGVEGDIGHAADESKVNAALPSITDINGENLVDIVFNGLNAIKDAANILLKTGKERAKCGRGVDILIKRAEGLTLEDVGQLHNVTRERIRQLEADARRDMPAIMLRVFSDLQPRLTQLSDAHASDDMKKWLRIHNQIGAFLTLKKGLAGIAQGDQCDSATLAVWSKLLIVTPQQLNEVDVKSLISILEQPLWHDKTTMTMALVYPGEFFSRPLVPRAEMPSEILLAPFPKGIDGTVESQFITDTVLPMLDGLDVESATSRIPTQFTLRGWPPVTTSLVSECLMLYWMARDGATLHAIDTDSSAKQERKRFIELLRESPRPLHDADEIFAAIRPDASDHPNPKSIVHNWIISVHANYLSTDDEDFPVKIGKSMIATMRHARAIGITDQKAAEITAFIEKTLASHPERQFSVTALFAKLKKNGYLTGLRWPDEWDHPNVTADRFPNMLKVVLYNQRPRNVRYMGRFIWKYGPWTDSPDTENRQHVYDFYRSLFLQQRRPLTARKMLQELKKQRDIVGVNQNQILEDQGLIKLRGNGLDAVYWHEDLGDLNGVDASINEEADSSSGKVEKEEQSSGVSDAEEARTKPNPPAESDEQPSSPAVHTPPPVFRDHEAESHDPSSPLTSTVPDRLNKKVVYKSEIVAAIDSMIQAKKRPMRAREIRRKLEADYGRAPSQIEPSGPLVVLQGEGPSALFWSRSLNKESDDDINALQQDALNWLNEKDEGLPVDKLMSLFPRHQKMLTRHDVIVWAAWLAQHEAMEITLSRKSRPLIYKRIDT